MKFFQDCIYSKLGTLAAMSLVNGGASFRLFSPWHCVYNFLCGMDAADLIAGIDEVADSGIRDTLKQVRIIAMVKELDAIIWPVFRILIVYFSRQPLPILFTYECL